ncbi:MAG: 2-oxo acid dehydrogenase subunit E2 [Planctomycetota bacterium]
MGKARRKARGRAKTSAKTLGGKTKKAASTAKTKAPPRARPAARKKAAAKPAARKTTARKPATRKAPAGKAPASKPSVRKPGGRKTSGRKTNARKTSGRRKSAKTVAAKSKASKAATSLKAKAPRGERAQPLSAPRRRYAESIVSTQQQAALLTTFDEVDLGQVQELRSENQDLFRSRYGVGLGVVSFFVRATVRALRIVPELNAALRGNKLVHREHHDIGMALGGEDEPVTPVLRDAGRLGFPDIERAMADYSASAREGALSKDAVAPGTFTICNSGTWGAMLSTPVLGPEQSGALGLHAVQDRPVVREGAVVVRPMMYVALTYDHRVVDGRQAVGFLRHVKEAVEDPMLHLM